MSDAIHLLIGTRKGAWTLRSDDTREVWTVEGPMFLARSSTISSPSGFRPRVARRTGRS